MQIERFKGQKIMMPAHTRYIVRQRQRDKDRQRYITEKIS